MVRALGTLGENIEDYTGGFQRVLLELADARPTRHSWQSIWTNKNTLSGGGPPAARQGRAPACYGALRPIAFTIFRKVGAAG